MRDEDNYIWQPIVRDDNLRVSPYPRDPIPVRPSTLPSPPNPHPHPRQSKPSCGADSIRVDGLHTEATSLTRRLHNGERAAILKCNIENCIRTCLVPYTVLG